MPAGTALGPVLAGYHRFVVSTRHRLTVAAVLALGIAVASPLLWFWPHDGAIDGWTVGFAVWEALPFAVLLLCHRAGFSDVGTVVTGVLVAVLTVVGYVAVERDESSTAAIALIIFPLYLAVFVAVAFFTELGMRHVVRRFGNRSSRF